MAQYKLTENPNIVLDQEHNPPNLVMLISENNPHTIAYHAWLAAGNVPDPYDNFNYHIERSKAYPSIADQLDMIYHDKLNNTNIWQTTIANIKSKYPKPSANT
jgi:hypothetical protein